MNTIAEIKRWMEEAEKEFATTKDKQRRIEITRELEDLLEELTWLKWA